MRHDSEAKMGVRERKRVARSARESFRYMMAVTRFVTVCYQVIAFAIKAGCDRCDPQPVFSYGTSDLNV